MAKDKIGFRLFLVLSIVFSMLIVNFNFTFAEETKVNWSVDIKEEAQMPDKQWSVDFTAPIDEDTINSDNIYVLDSDENKFDDIKLEVIDDTKVLVIPTKDYVQGETYYLCVSDGVKSKLGTKLRYPIKTEFKIKKIDSDFFKIRNVDVISKNIVNVYFTQPINSGSELELYYNIMDGDIPYIEGSFQSIEVHKIKEVNNGVSVFLKNDFLLDNNEYTLKIKGDLVSDYGVRLNSGNGDEINFTGKSNENEDLDIVSAVAIDDSTIEIEFNKEFDATTAERVSNYSIKDEDGIPKGPSGVVLSEDGKKVRLEVIGTLSSTKEYILNVNYIKDSFKQSTLNINNYDIDIKNNDEKAMDIDGAFALYSNILVVYFNEKPDPESAVNPSNYQISGVTDSKYYTTFPMKVSYDPSDNAYMVKLYLNKDFKDSEKYSVRISKDMKDQFGNKNSDYLQYTFKGVDIENEGLYIKEAVIIGSRQIKLNFNEEILNNSKNTDPSNYVLESNQGENRKVILGCSDVKYADSKTLILTFDDLRFDENYLLKIDSLTDFLGKNTDKYESGINISMGQ